MDILVPITMKSAAKCDKQCELQNSANHQILERNWRWRDILPACLFQCPASEIRQEHPLNLSILLSGGKEINEDCPSSGERSGKSSSLICGHFGYRIVI